MRLYIGTLHTIENEFEDCLAAIRRQTHPNFEHVVFSGLGNAEAHEKLFGEFLSKRNEFDLMIKIDADMVLIDDHLFEKIEARVQEKDLSVLTIAVHDWFSDRLICGLASYRNDIQWVGDKAKVFVDNVKVQRGGKEFDQNDMAPAAHHCPNPSPFQAFHFGLHKATKVIQRGLNSRVHWRMRQHWENIKQTEHHFKRTGDRRLALAILASELAFSGVFTPEHVNYDHPFLNKIFSHYEHMPLNEVVLKIKFLRRRNLGWLPEHIRQAWLWFKFRKKRLSLYAIKRLLADCFDLDEVS